MGKVLVNAAALGTYSCGVLFVCRPRVVLQRYRRAWEASRQIARTPALRDEVDARLIGLMLLALAVMFMAGAFGWGWY